jgi:predicted nucleic acid-binding protein
MTDAGSAYLIDTNILIYAYDARDAFKQRRAVDVMRTLQASKLGALSVQVLGEFYVNVTRKPLFPLTVEEARLSSVRLCRSWPVLDVTAHAYLDALQGVSLFKLSFWDALVWATARNGGIGSIVTEDQEHLRLVGDVRYYNPFDQRFDLSMLG